MINRSLPSDRRTPLTYVALGDSTVFGLGASHASRNYVSRVFAHLRIEYPSATLAQPGQLYGQRRRRPRPPGAPTPSWTARTS